MSIDDWFTLEKAATHLGVSSRTLRRWIKTGKLQARLEPGPYGQQYVVPRSSLQGLQIVRDVEREERRAERDSIPGVLEAYLSERESALNREISTLRAEMHEAVGRLEAQQTAILQILEGLRETLAARSTSTADVDEEVRARRP